MLRAPWLSGPWLNPVTGKEIFRQKNQKDGDDGACLVEVEQGFAVAVSLFSGLFCCKRGGGVF